MNSLPGAHGWATQPPRQSNGHRRVLMVLAAVVSALLLVVFWPQPAAAQDPVSQQCEEVRQLTNFPTGFSAQPTVNNDGTRIAFWSTSDPAGQNSDGNIEMFVADIPVDATVLPTFRQVRPTTGSILGGFNLSPSISGDGTSLVFFADQDIIGQNPDRNFEIFLYDIEADTLQQLTTSVSDVNILPSISTNGERIAFASDRDWTGDNPDGSLEIFLLDLDSGSFTQITDSDAGINDQPAISGDGTHIAFASDGNPLGTNQDGNAEIFLATIDTNGNVSLTQVTDTDGGTTNFQPTIDEDGSNVAFTTNRDGNDEIYRAEISSGGIDEKRVTDTGPSVSNDQPSISADGTRAVFVQTGTASQSIMLYDAVGDTLSPLFTEDVDVPIGSPTASADGTYITYSVDRHIYARACRFTDVEVTKTAPTSVIAGEPLTYTVTVTNHGPALSPDIVVTDELPADFTYQGVFTETGTTCSKQDDVITCTRDVLPIEPPTNTLRITITGSISPSVPVGTILTNTVSVDADVFDRNPDNNTVTVTRDVGTEADLLVDLIDSPDPVVAGETLTYTLHYTNTTPSDAQDVVITTTLPAEVTFGGIVSEPGTLTRTTSDAEQTQRWEIATLEASDDGTIVFTTTVASSAVFTIDATAGITSTTRDPDPANNSVSETTTVDTEVDLVLNKTDTPDTDVVAGESLTYTLTYTNTGPSDARAVAITDTLPDGVRFDGASVPPAVTAGTTYTWTVPLLPAEATGTIVISTTVYPTTTQTLTNVAGIKSTTTERDPGTNVEQEDTPVTTEADLVVTKEGPPDVMAGEAFTYTIGVTNTGPSAARNVLITDTLPVSVTHLTSESDSGTCQASGDVVTCTLGTLGVAATSNVTISVDLDPAARGSLENTVDVTSDEPDPDGATDTITTPVATEADLVATKVGTPDTVLAGADTLTYTIHVTNTGPSLAQNVRITDTLPDGLDFGAVTTVPADCDSGTQEVTCDLSDLSVGPGAARTITITAPVAADALDPLVNEVEVTSDEPDPTQPAVTATTAVTRQAELTLDKVGSTATVFAGDPVVYTVTVSNPTGPSTARDVTISDTLDLPTGASYSSTSPECVRTGDTIRCENLGTFDVGGTDAITVAVSVDADAPAGGVITNTAQVTSAEPNPAGTPVETVITEIERRAAMTVTKIASSDPVTAGKRITYTIGITNQGPSTATGVQLTDTLPAGVDETTATASPGCTTGGATITCALAGFNVMETREITVSVAVDPDRRTALQNTVEVAATESVTVAETTLSTDVVGEANLSVVKTAHDNTVVAGQQITYTIAVTNVGPSTASNVVVSDTLPNDVDFITGTTGAGTVCSDGDPITCDLGTLTIDETQTVTITGEVASNSNATTITNEATAGSDEINPGDPSDTEETTVTRASELEITKAPHDPVVAGAPLTYTISVTNTGPSVAKNVIVTDTVPAGTTFDAAGSSADCTEVTTGIVRCTPSGNISTGTGNNTRTFDVVVDVGPATRGVLTNTVAVSATTASAVTVYTDTAAVTTDVALTLDKRTATSEVNAGEPLTYTLTVTNTGRSQATDVTISDTIPVSLTGVVSSTTDGFTCESGLDPLRCSLATLDPAANASMIVTGTVDTDTPDNATIVNTAAVTATEDAAGASDTTTTTVRRVAELDVSKAGPDTVVAGEQLTYTIRVTNTGKIPATDVTISDTLPADTSYASHTTSHGTCSESGGLFTCSTNALNVGVTQAVTLTLDVAPAAADGSTISNTVQVTATEDVDVTTAAVTTTVTQHSVLLVTKAPLDTAVAGAPLTYTINVTNTGPSVAVGVTAIDTLPNETSFNAAESAGICSEVTAGTVICNVGNLDASGAGRFAEFDIVVDVGTAVRGTLTNTVEVSAATAPLDDVYTDTTAVTTDVTLTLDKQTVTTEVNAGEPLTYTLTVTNTGRSQATDVTISDTIPVSLTGVVSSTLDGFTCESGLDPLRCSLATLDPAASASMVITGTVPTDTPDGATIVNTAAVTATEDADGADDTITTTVNREVTLEITKSASADPTPRNDVLTYTVWVTNTGPSLATDVTISDTFTLPMSVTQQSQSPTCAPLTSDTLRCDLADLDRDASSVITVTFFVSETANTGDVITNTARLTATEDTTGVDTSIATEIGSTITSLFFGSNTVLARLQQMDTQPSPIDEISNDQWIRKLWVRFIQVPIRRMYGSTT